MCFLWIRSVEAKYALREPFRQIQSERIAILSFQNHIVILRIVEENMTLVDDRKDLVDWLHGSARCFVRQVKNYLFLSVES